MSRRAFTSTLLLYAGIKARNFTERAFLAHGRRKAAKGVFYPRDWSWE
jgi:hypothetical protein